MHSSVEFSRQMRVELTDDIMKRFFHRIFTGTVSDFSTVKGLSYSLVYNLVHGRIASLSARDYRIIFGEDPPLQDLKRIDAQLFRGMVRLWLFLNKEATKADLYRDFYPNRHFHKIDYRIFSGQIRTIEPRLERIMERKFAFQGVNKAEMKSWIREMGRMGEDERIDYEEIRLILKEIQETTGIDPSRILNQWVGRYESGELNTVPKSVYEKALEIKTRVDSASDSGFKLVIERIREEIYGKRKGLILFSEVERELEFLRTYGGRSSKDYLNRSISKYKKSKLKRIAAWRAQKIKSDYEHLLREKPYLAVISLQTEVTRKKVSELVMLLKRRIFEVLMQEPSEESERLILSFPWHMDDETVPSGDGLRSMDEAASALEMSKRAFDLLVANHVDFFRRIAVHEGRWLLPMQYIVRLAEMPAFQFVKEKYEMLAAGDCSRYLPNEEKVTRWGVNHESSLFTHSLTNSWLQMRMMAYTSSEPISDDKPPHRNKLQPDDTVVVDFYQPPGIQVEAQIVQRQKYGQQKETGLRVTSQKWQHPQVIPGKLRGAEEK